LVDGKKALRLKDRNALAHQLIEGVKELLTRDRWLLLRHGFLSTLPS
jgi:hypothetical protein